VRRGLEGEDGSSSCAPAAEASNSIDASCRSTVLESSRRWMSLARLAGSSDREENGREQTEERIRESMASTSEPSHSWAEEKTWSSR
jgi:hypothetical protein